MPLDNPLNERVKAKKLHCNKGKKRNIGRKKVMKKNILVILSILIITILSGCQKKEEVSTYEQDRVAKYILDNLELVDGSEIKKIKFLRFEIPNTAAQTWDIDVEINDTITMLLSENRLGDELSYAYDPEELKTRKEKKEIRKEKKEIRKEKKEKRNIEIIYIKEKY